MVPGHRKDVLVVECSGVHIDGELRRPVDALLGVVGTFTIRIGAVVHYQEEEFPVVEFGSQLARWLSTSEASGVDFVYTSEESEVPGLVRFEHAGEDHWRLSAYDLGLQQRVVLPAIFGPESLRETCIGYLEELWQQLPKRTEVVRGLEEDGATELVTFFRDRGGPVRE